MARPRAGAEGTGRRLEPARLWRSIRRALEEAGEGEALEALALTRVVLAALVRRRRRRVTAAGLTDLVTRALMGTGFGLAARCYVTRVLMGRHRRRLWHHGRDGVGGALDN